MRLPPEDNPDDSSPLIRGLLLPGEGSSGSGDVCSFQKKARPEVVAPSTPQEEPLDSEEFSMPMTWAPSSLLPHFSSTDVAGYESLLTFQRTCFGGLFFVGRASLKNGCCAIHLMLVHDAVGVVRLAGVSLDVRDDLFEF
ncbi:hypothetical protein MRX96_034470 [Rhipicephalus microplus]